MNSCNRSFAKGFEKVAAPSWFYEMNKNMNAKKLKNISTVSLKNTKIGKGIK
jgi:hypothetical protein